MKLTEQQKREFVRIAREIMRGGGTEKPRRHFLEAFYFTDRAIIAYSALDCNHIFPLPSDGAARAQAKA